MASTSALSSLIALTNKTLGFVPSTPSEFDEASFKIEKVIKMSFSPSSLKRLWGYVDYTNEPAKSTLNKLARYNGYPDYQTFIDSLSADLADDSGFLEDSLISTDRIAAGDRLALAWNDGKECLMLCIAPRRFRVEASKNIKLQEGDTLTIHIIGIGHPIYATDIVRGGEHISAYHGAKKGGLRSFRHLIESGH